MKRLVRTLWHDESGQDLTEYGLLMVLVALAAITGVKAFATTLNNALSNGASNFSAAST